MLGAAAAIFLSLLPSNVNGLITADAKCVPGYEWTYSSIGQTPCDVAAELGSVCAPGGQFNVEPLPVGYQYLGPSLEIANGCRCSSVYYSSLSACAYCQGRDYIGWVQYSTNCSTVYVTVYNQPLPAGVKVPAYAYQNVSTSGSFDVALAQSMKGAESSAVASGTISTPYSTTTGSSNKNNTPAIVGGVVGGLVGLGVLGIVITYLVFRSRRRKKAQIYNPGLQQSPQMALTPNTIAPLIPPTTSPPPGSPPPGSVFRVYDPNDPSTFPSPDPNLNAYDPYRQQTSNVHMPSHFTGNSAHSGPPQQMSQSTGGRTYVAGVPEL